VFLLAALAFALLYRRRKQKNTALALAAKNASFEKTTPPVHAPLQSAYARGAKGAAVAGARVQRPHANTYTNNTTDSTTTNLAETPEWNIEMDATSSERHPLVPRPSDHTPPSAAPDASELGGMARVPRKQIAPVELDGSEVRAEVGDAYIPYRPAGRR
jgi:hypothetical protein